MTIDDITQDRMARFEDDEESVAAQTVVKANAASDVARYAWGDDDVVVEEPGEPEGTGVLVARSADANE